jgi:hypothetical protein
VVGPVGPVLLEILQGGIGGVGCPGAERHAQCHALG